MDSSIRPNLKKGKKLIPKEIWPKIKKPKVVLKIKRPQKVKWLEKTIYFTKIIEGKPNNIILTSFGQYFFSFYFLAKRYIRLLLNRPFYLLINFLNIALLLAFWHLTYRYRLKPNIKNLIQDKKCSISRRSAGARTRFCASKRSGITFW